MTVRRVEAEALATFVRQLRPDWDHPGIVAAIGRCKREPLSEIAVALIRLAENGRARTPALLPGHGRHWANASIDDGPAGPNLVRRDTCWTHPGQDRATCPDCATERGRPTTDAERAEYVAACWVVLGGRKNR